MKLKKLNNKGETLVEIIIGVVLLAIASIMLVNGFVATANIVNRANMYKAVSAAAVSSVELQENQFPADAGGTVKLDLDKQTATITVKGTKKDSSSINFNLSGEYILCSDISNVKTNLTYREFLPGSVEFDVPAISLEDDD